MATVHQECGFIIKDEVGAKNLYNSFIGRGLVQLTHRNNYLKYSAESKLPGRKWHRLAEESDVSERSKSCGFHSRSLYEKWYSYLLA